MENQFHDNAKGDAMSWLSAGYMFVAPIVDISIPILIYYFVKNISLSANIFAPTRLEFEPCFVSPPLAYRT